jgi:phosphoribosyl 1,2-cyclic phosphate phosphodiesterase
MPYCFAENRYPGAPLIKLREINEELFQIEGVDIQPVRILHAKLPALGFKIGKMAYLTDVKYISEKTVELLQGLDVLILNSLRIKPHISHLNLEEAIDLTNKINAKKTYFTHMSHDMGKHENVSLILPQHIELAYDGLTISL